MSTHVNTTDKTEQDIRESIDMIARTGKISLWRYDIAKRKFYSLLGRIFMPDGTTYEQCADALTEDGIADYNRIFENLISGKTDKENIVFHFIDSKTGADIFYKSELTIRIDNQGNRESILGIQIDITEEIIQKKTLEDFKIKTNLINNKNHIIGWDFDIEQQTITTYGKCAIESGATISKELYLSKIHPENQKDAIDAINKMTRREATSLDLKLRTYLPGYHNYRYVDISGVAVKDQKGKILSYTGISRDTTKETIQQKELIERRYKTDLVEKSSGLTLWEYDSRKHIFISDDNEAYGKELTFQDYLDSTHPLYKEQAARVWDILGVGADKSFSVNWKYYSQGEWRYSVVAGEPYEKDVNGKVTRYLGYRRDTTEFVKLSQSMEESNNLLSNILTQSPSIIFIKDISDNFRYIMANDMFSQFIHKSKEEIIGKIDEEIFERDAAARMHNDDLIAINRNEIYSFVEEIVINDRTRSVHTIKKAMETNGRQLLIGISTDITDTIEQQRALERANKKAELVLNNANAGFVYIDNDFKVLWENSESVKDIIPHIQRSKRGCICYENVYGLDKPCDNCIILRAKNSLKTEKETKILEDNKVLEINVTPVIDKNKNINGYVCRIDNVTEAYQQKRDLDESKARIEEVNALLQSIIRQIPFGLYIKDISNNMRYVIMNDVLARLDGTDSSSAIGKTDYEIFDKKIADMFRQEDNEAINKPDGELTIVKNEINWRGKMYIYENSTTVITVAGNRRLLIGVVADITENEKMINDLKEAKEHAEQSDKLKSAFLANMSHEIRTPLNAIVGFSELLAEAENSEDKKEYSNIISLNNELLLRLIGDILDLSKIESGMIDLKPEEFNIAETYSEIFTMIRQKGVKSDVDLIIESPYSSCIVKLDRNRFKQVIINFMTNAVKYTVVGYIKMGYKYVDNGIKVYVEDTGIGIAKENHPKIFDRFEKFDTFAQGTGLGLSICKAIVEAQGGKIGYEARQEKGSIFWAWFPCSAKINTANGTDQTEHLSNNEKSKEQPTDNSNFKILIAEDNDSNYLLMKYILKGYNLTRANNGVEVIECVKINNFDIVLMDWKMPVMDGLEATQKIREFNSAIPIIAVTANSYDSDIAAITKAGCNDFVAKPIRKQDLINIIDKYKY